MSLTNIEIIEGVINTLEDLRDLVCFEGGTGVADFSEWLEDIDNKLREANAALTIEQTYSTVIKLEQKREQNNAE